MVACIVRSHTIVDEPYIERRTGEKSLVDTVVEALVLDLLDWLAIRDRSYEEVMDAWRTSCPRLPVWEDANDRGLVMRREVNGRSIVRITSSGLALLKQRKPFQPVNCDAK
jgi:hypothetical protein